MLDLKLLKTDYAISYGSVTLKSLQNDNIPELDLLVREAIQNSSDAALNEPGSSFDVNFSYGSFVPHKFNENLQGLKEVLNKKYPDDSAHYLEIRDTKTCGLTGSYKRGELKSDDHGNFFKLIYDTGKKQNNTAAGGNWGFGKSVYYRVGIGIVIFYSQIKTNSGYENRLIITLVEDENKTDKKGEDITLLGSIDPLSAGKAWWGIKENKEIFPIRDNNLIKSILDIFDIKPFKQNETGTSIIIPYIDEEKLLDDIIPADAIIQPDVREHFLDVWGSSIPDYLKLSIQKWYAPKIHNRELVNFCDKKWLSVHVNNISLTKQDLLPFFNLAQELYTTAMAKAYSSNYESSSYAGIVTLPVRINNYFDDGPTAGFVSLIRINRQELNGSKNVLSPYDYIGKFEIDGGLNEPIMMYARDPGMIIDYAISNSWVKNLTPPDNPDEYIFAFFVPITNKEIKKDYAVSQYSGMKLGEYLRACESSDHMGWTDPVKMRIVQRIQNNTINRIIKLIKEDADIPAEATASKLSNKLGKNLLPKIGYGRKRSAAAGAGGGAGGGGGTKKRDTSFDIVAQDIRNDEVEISFSLKMAHGKEQTILSIMTASEDGVIDLSSWEKDIGTIFPIKITGCYIEKIETTAPDHTYAIEALCTTEHNNIKTPELDVSLCAETDTDVLTQIIISSRIPNPEISGSIRLKPIEKKYQFVFRVD
jgi:hypothetical protein